MRGTFHMATRLLGRASPSAAGSTDSASGGYAPMRTSSSPLHLTTALIKSRSAATVVRLGWLFSPNFAAISPHALTTVHTGFVRCLGDPMRVAFEDEGANECLPRDVIASAHLVTG